MTDAPAISIRQAIADERLFGGVFRDKGTWVAWLAFLGAFFGLALSEVEQAIYRACTGRPELPTAPFAETWLVCGRRSGKSFIMALVAVFLAAFRDYRAYLAPGERVTIMVIAADKRQARVVMRFVRGFLAIPALSKLIEADRSESIDLTRQVTIEVQTPSFRSVRGYSIAAALCDELAFWALNEDSVSPDVEVLAALRPAMSTIPGALLLCASSPYARRGALWENFKRYFGKDDPSVLVWKAATRTMNPSVPQRIIDDAMERDISSATAEYLAEFRTDVESFISRQTVDACVCPRRYELPPVAGIHYVGFVDPSGGSQDSMTVCVAHLERATGTVVIDAIRERRPPFSPDDVVREFAELLRVYRIYRLVGDHWGGEFVREPFRKAGVDYSLAEQPKSDLYRDSLPRLNSGTVQLLDHSRLITQLCGLERRTARSGRDSIDHAPGGHDDIANVVCGAIVYAAKPQIMFVSAAALAAGKRPGPETYRRRALLREGTNPDSPTTGIRKWNRCARNPRLSSGSPPARKRG